MIRYAVMTDTFEFNPQKFPDISEAFMSRSDTDAHPLATFDTMEEAKAYIDTCKPSTQKFSLLTAATMTNSEPSPSSKKQAPDLGACFHLWRGTFSCYFFSLSV